ncbi:hypothetical protein BDC45DRAFT_538550 [Circinella umbellata]|nr:hypothetical protein BDC45DRAFT_538550 [Circinella umbellata]
MIFDWLFNKLISDWLRSPIHIICAQIVWVRSQKNNVTPQALLETKSKEPATDFMSKVISLKADIIMSLSVKKIIGPHAVDKYKGISTEWPNLMKLDVVSEPFLYNDRNSPPVLIDIQHTVDLKFYQQVIQYCL